jgi:superfamily II DNA or RNA helicase
MKNPRTELLTLFKKYNTIKDCIGRIEELRLSIKNPEEQTDFINAVRARIQNEACFAVIKNGGRGLVVLPTGAGKSKVAVDLIKHYYEDWQKLPRVGLIVPTEKLRDENWEEEFTKWKAQEYFTNIAALCYASGSKVKGEKLDLLILDEVHRTTELSSEFFGNNQVNKVIALTATPPTEQDKIELLENQGIKLVYELSLDQAVRFGFVAPYKITVITVPLNSTLKNVKGGNKKNPFYQTEQAAYDYASTNIENMKPLGGQRLQFAILRRMHLIYGLQSKTDVIKYLLEKVVPWEERSLIFCSNIKQAEEVCSTSFHSKSKDDAYQLFKEGKINRLSCVKALDEGVNFVGLDSAIIGQVNSKERGLVQRIGRLIRYRPGHQAHIYIVMARGTQDEKWLESATENLDENQIEYIPFNQLKLLY